MRQSYPLQLAPVVAFYKKYASEWGRGRCASEYGSVWEIVEFLQNSYDIKSGTGKTTSKLTTSTTTSGDPCTGVLELTGTSANQPVEVRSYAAGTICQWKLTCAAANTFPQLTFDDFATEMGHGYLRLHNGQTTSDPKGKFTRRAASSQHLRTACMGRYTHLLTVCSACSLGSELLRLSGRLVL